MSSELLVTFFFFNDTATTEIYTLSLHDALPIYLRARLAQPPLDLRQVGVAHAGELRESPHAEARDLALRLDELADLDRKSTRLNSSHANISYAVFCLKKNKHDFEY